MAGHQRKALGDGPVEHFVRPYLARRKLETELVRVDEIDQRCPFARLPGIKCNMIKAGDTQELQYAAVCDVQGNMVSILAQALARRFVGFGRGGFMRKCQNRLVAADFLNKLAESRLLKPFRLAWNPQGQPASQSSAMINSIRQGGKLGGDGWKRLPVKSCPGLVRREQRAEEVVRLHGGFPSVQYSIPGGGWKCDEAKPEPRRQRSIW